MFMRGAREAARAALNRSFAIAEERGDALDQLRLLGPLNMFHLRAGDFQGGLPLRAAMLCRLPGNMDEPVASRVSPFTFWGFRST